MNTRVISKTLLKESNESECINLILWLNGIVNLKNGGGAERRDVMARVRYAQLFNDFILRYENFLSDHTNIYITINNIWLVDNNIYIIY